MGRDTIKIKCPHCKKIVGIPIQWEISIDTLRTVYEEPFKCDDAYRAYDDKDKIKGVKMENAKTKKKSG